MLAEAFSRLPRDLALRLEIRGTAKGPEQQLVERSARRVLEGDARVQFLTAVPWHEVISVLKGYNLLCCSSVCLEGGPTVAMEAHAVGTPVIGSNVGGLPEFVSDRENGRLVDPGDWQALRDVLHEVAERPAETIDAWRRRLAFPRTMDDIAADHLALYQASRCS